MAAAVAGLVALSGQAAERVELTTRVSGVVEAVLVSPGQRVKKGEPLVRLEPTIHQARLDEAGAELERARADEADARRDLDRVQELYNRTVSSTTELDAARLRYARAKAALTVVESRVAVARKNLEDATLKAPFDGVIAALAAAPGMVVVADCQQPRPLLWMSREP
jgi:RND family efflux transporter MFP subunit